MSYAKKAPQNLLCLRRAQSNVRSNMDRLCSIINSSTRSSTCLRSVARSLRCCAWSRGSSDRSLRQTVSVVRTVSLALPRESTVGCVGHIFLRVVLPGDFQQKTPPKRSFLLWYGLVPLRSNLAQQFRLLFWLNVFVTRACIQKQSCSTCYRKCSIKDTNVDATM